MVKDDVQELADLLHSASIHLLRRAGEEDAKSGIGAARLSALSVLVFRGAMTLGELAEAEGVRSPTMTRIVQGLEGANLVRRVPHEHDRRSRIVEATSQGRRALQAARRRRIERIADTLQQLTPQERRALRREAELVERLFGHPERPWRPLRRHVAGPGAAIATARSSPIAKSAPARPRAPRG
ncbi:MAG: MarR family transcriptional regulator, partial [Actinobacteria bacterium]|nr:MarR family transcriptional regulator [Actinomycetota bacterium]